MRQNSADGVGGRADGRTSSRERIGRQANGGRPARGQVDGPTGGSMGGLASKRTGADDGGRIPEG